MIIKKFAMLALTIGAFVLMGLTTASSQGYPSRPITLIVPYSPGGPTDSLARILIDHMGCRLASPS
jgi:tripartite-type tricarboxylate transporter receptor subunit TctC